MITLRQTVSLKQQLKLSQILSPKMIQMLRTFHYSYTDLVEQLNQSVDDNVVLEVARYDELMTYSQRVGSGDRATEIDQVVAKSDGSLATYLLDQLSYEQLSEKDEAIGRALIDAIDARGYVERYPQVRDQICQRFQVDDRKVLAILRIIQSMEPDGVGARSLKECLLIQVESHQFESDRLKDVLKQVIRCHLDDLGASQNQVVADALGIELDGVSAISEFIRSNLNPNPGLAYGGGANRGPIVPSFSISIENNQITVVNLEETKGLQLAVSQRYLSMLADPSIDDESRTYLKDRVQKAQELIENIRRRQAALGTLARYLVTQQLDFIHHGAMYLVPLLQKHVAEALNLSPSTISRIVSSKYIETPHGMVPLKMMCPRGHSGQTARRLAAVVSDVCNEYPGLSDIKIATVLKERGIDIARRTVAKYRQLGGVASSGKRDG